MILTLQRYITSDNQFPSFKAQWDKLQNKEDLDKNALLLIAKVSELLSRMGNPDITVTSGWRPLAHNLAIGGSKNSHHVWARAIDIWDPKKILGKWCMDNIEALREIGLYMESLVKTHASEDEEERWLHLQSVPPPSKNIVFIP